MRSILSIIGILSISIMLISCGKKSNESPVNIIFLHHSTGNVIWNGNNTSLISKAAGKISYRLANLLKPEAELPSLFEKYNRKHGKNFRIQEMTFPKIEPYGWNNFPFDYYNIWVKNSGVVPYLEEPTLEMLTKNYQVIIFKHCFPVCNILPDSLSGDINSDVKTISNYKMQYIALRDKIHQFPDTKFIIFTGAALVRSLISEEEARRAQIFFNWVKEEWDLPEDNIYLWDLYQLQTQGGLYFKDEFAVSPNDPHPNPLFAEMTVSLLFNRITDIIETNGYKTLLTGEDQSK